LRVYLTSRSCETRVTFHIDNESNETSSYYLKQLDDQAAADESAESKTSDMTRFPFRRLISRPDIVLSRFKSIAFICAPMLLTACWEHDVQDNALSAQTPGFSIPVADISQDTTRQVVVDREHGQYLGHPTTVLLENGKTILTTYPKGHGRGAIVYKRSDDAGLTWSERLPVPESWSSSLEVPTLYRVTDRSGTSRLLVFSGLFPIRMAISDDDGESWSELDPIGDFGGIVAMSSLVRLADGSHMAFFHDDGRFIHGEGAKGVFRVYKTLSRDGGLTWGNPEIIVEREEVDLCEPGAVRSPDGKQLALLLRENSRTRNSHIVFSDDEGASWSEPRQLPGALTGDRHTARYLPDGRLFISFRDMGLESPTKGDWVGWIGSYGDLVSGEEGQFRVRIMDNKNGWDSTYPGVEVLPDGTIVTTTYGHWIEGEEPYIVSVRFRVEELESMLHAE